MVKAEARAVVQSALARGERRAGHGGRRARQGWKKGGQSADGPREFGYNQRARTARRVSTARGRADRACTRPGTVPQKRETAGRRAPTVS